MVYRNKLMYYLLKHYDSGAYSALHSASVCQFDSISDALLVLKYLLQAYRAIRLWIISILDI